MSDGGKRILTKIKRTPDIYNSLVKSLYSNKLDNRDAEFLYTIALLLIDEYEKDPKKHLIIEYSYFIIAHVSFAIKDFRALYDFSINYGYYPIARKIIELDLLNNLSISHILSDISIDEYIDGNKMMTYEQKKEFTKVLADNSKNISFIAPTSYGKSELIFEHMKKHDSERAICIIVPTKSLINQTFQDAKKIVNDRKIIIHDQNYEKDKDNRVLSIVTQERALRLIEDGMIFDVIYVDEAHELLDFNFKYNFSNRSLLLARLIQICRIKNNKLREIYLSPVIQDSSSLKIIGSDEIIQHKIFNDLKILNIHFLNRNKILSIYDRYLGRFIEVGTTRSVSEYIEDTARLKNLHFLYRPIFIEQYSEKLYHTLNSEYNIPDEISELVDELKQIVHPNFKLAKYLSKGIVYLHGKIPLVVRNYILKHVKESEYIKHFIANSVILAGMNLPIDNLFYICGYANVRDLYNLIGRVNRLNEIFSIKNNDLEKIFIPIHFLEINEFPQNRNGSLKSKIEKLRGNYKDEVKNPILDKYKLDVKNQNYEKALEIKRVEKGLIEEYDNPDFENKLLRAGSQQLLNYSNIGLEKLKEKMHNYSEIIENNQILNVVKEIFFDGFMIEDFNPEYNVKRLENKETINYYNMFINDLQTRTLRQRIDKLVKYWYGKRNIGYKIYVGSQFGEVPYSSDNYKSSWNKVYVNLDDHLNDIDYLYNLAIIKLQTDEDYLNHEITILVSTLQKFDIINQNQLDIFIYGTDSESLLKILRLGISKNIYMKLVNDNQIQNIIFDDFGNARANKELEAYINQQKGIDKFELMQHFI